MKKLMFIIIFSFISFNLIYCQAIKESINESSEENNIIESKIRDAQYYIYIGNIDKAREIFFELIILDKKGDIILSKEYKAEIYFTIGYLYEYELNMDNALIYYQKALYIFREIYYKEESYIVSIFISRIYYSKLNYEKTIEYLELSIKLYDSNIDKANLYIIVKKISRIYFYTEGVNKSIYYIENIINEEMFQYNNEEKLNIMILLAYYYQRSGDYTKYTNIVSVIDKYAKKYNIDKTTLDYFLYKDIYKYINKGDYGLALGLTNMIALSKNTNISIEEHYFEILRIKRILNDENLQIMQKNIPISMDYFKDYPYLYAGLFSIELGYRQGKLINFASGVDKLNRATYIFKVNKDKFHQAEAILSRGILYYIKGNYEESIKNFVDSYSLYKELNLKFEWAISSKYLGLSFLNKENTEKQSALAFLIDSTILFEKLENNYELAPLYEKISHIYELISQKDLQNLYIKKAIYSYNKIGRVDKVEFLMKTINN